MSHHCFQEIQIYPRQESFFQIKNEQKEIGYAHRKLKILLKSSYCELCFLEIHLEQNYLLYEPERFVIWNKTCQLQELPIWNRFILFKEYQYEIYDKKDKILEWNGIYLSIYE